MSDKKQVGGKPEVTLTNKMISLNLSTVLKKRLDKYVETHGVDQSSVLRMALDDFLSRHDL